jgi:hypothetical protein
MALQDLPEPLVFRERTVSPEPPELTARREPPEQLELPEPRVPEAQPALTVQRAPKAVRATARLPVFRTGRRSIPAPSGRFQP